MITRVLPEHEGLELARSLGLGVPTFRLLGPAPEPDGELLEAFAGDRLVIKARVPGLAHKTEAGAVEVVARDLEAVRQAMTAMERRLRGSGLQGFMLQEFLPHEAGIAGELLVNLRDTREFGPVVTVGPGGTLTEFWAWALGSEGGPLHLSPEGSDQAAVRAALLKRPWGRLLHEGVRGVGGRADIDGTVHLVRSLLTAADGLVSAGLVEAEFNPVAVTEGGGLQALDAMVRVREGVWGGEGALQPAEGTPSARPRSQGHRHGPRDLSPLLEPESMAILGVSARGMNPGRIILRNTLEEGFSPERLWVVKPGCAELDGCPCVDSLADLPEPVDTLVLALPGSDAPAALAEAVSGGRTRSVVLIPGGLGEVQGTGARVEAIRSTLDEVRALGLGDIPVNGGNCLGIRTTSGKVNSLFIPRHKLSFPEKEPDPLAFISQSGAFAVARLSAWPERNPAVVVTVGNQIDVTVADYVESMLERPEIRVVALYVEGFTEGDGRRVARAAGLLREEGRALVLYRAGRTPAGKAASASHTASMAGDAQVTSSACGIAGALVAETLDEFDGLVSLSLALADRPFMGRRFAAVSNAGFECVALMDHVSELAAACFTPETVRRVQEVLDENRVGEIVAAVNPLDLTPMMGDRGFETLVRAVLEDAGSDLALVGCVPLTGALQTLHPEPGHGESVLEPESIAQRLVGVWRDTTRPWAAVIDGGPAFDPMVRVLKEGGIPVFRSGDLAARLFSRYAAWRLAD